MVLSSALVYLCAAVLAVPIAKRLGLGSVLGYLLAGVVIGPFVMKFVGDQTEVMHFAEFGVVMMLFIVGLELRPERLWTLRRQILGLGGLQVLLTTLIIFGAILWITPLSWQMSLAIGLTLALSSTAMVLQSLTEKGWLKSQAGSNSFSVLLFQDIAVIPILALIPMLSFGMPESNPSTHSSLIHDFPVWAQGLVSVITIAAIVIAGRFLSPPVFRFIADTRLQEVFTAFTLLIVIAIAVLMQSIGLSPALGSFLAGVVLAESEFRHELEVNLSPFKGLLLGLFFITVGASIDFNLLFSQPVVVTFAVICLIVFKMFVLSLLAIFFKMDKQQGALFTVCLAQGGEFAFVLVNAGIMFAVFTADIGNMINLVVALSMLVTPLLLVVYEKRFTSNQAEEMQQEHEDIEPTNDVIIAGYGRFGQIIGRLLKSQGYHTTILDHSPSQIALLRRFGSKAFYGDPSRHELLHAAGAEDAKILVVAADESEKTVDIIKVARKHFPHLKILVRAYDRRHAYELMQYDVDIMRRETFDSSLYLGVEALKLLGQDPAKAERAGKIFAEHDHQSMHLLATHWGDDKSYSMAIRERNEDLQRVLEQDMEDYGETPPPKENA